MKQLHLQVYSLLEDVEYIKVGFGGYDEDELCGKGWLLGQPKGLLDLSYAFTEYDEEASGAADSTADQ